MDKTLEVDQLLPLVLRYKNSVIIICLMLIFAVVAKRIKDSYTGRYVQLEKVSKEVAAKKEIVTRIKSFEEETKRLRSRVVKGDIFHFKKLIEDLASQADVSIISLVPDINNAPKDYSEVTVNLVLDCMYEDLIGFITKLEEAKIAEVSAVTRREEATGGSTFSVQLVGMLED